MLVIELEKRIHYLEGVLSLYADRRNWMTPHTDPVDDTVEKVWIGSDEHGYLSAERALTPPAVEETNLFDLLCGEPNDADNPHTSGIGR